MSQDMKKKDIEMQDNPFSGRPRFFVDFSFEEGGEYALRGEAAAHISRSLRMKKGERLVICDNAQRDGLCVIEGIEGETVQLRVEVCAANKAEPHTRVSVYQCLPKLDKLETVIQKSTELGAVKIVPVQSSRCIVKSDPKKLENKTARLQKIALEAAKQSGRGVVPVVTKPMRLELALEAAKNVGEVFLFYEKGVRPFKEVIRQTSAREIAIFIGPEGGFSEDEVGVAVAGGAHVITLGRRILRTETVAPSVLSMIFYEKDEIYL